jgi:hypothetical protein
VPAPPLLRIYLNDHLAGATAGTALARRCLSRNRSGPLGDFLTRLVREIEEDRASLRDVMRRVGARQNPAKRAAARMLERAGLAKLNGSLTSYTPLSRLVELEGLSAGVEAKRLLWLSLRAALGSDPRLADIDLERLAERARSQREGLEEHRIAAAEQALAAGSVSRAGKV